jgi:hypothetical protein
MALGGEANRGNPSWGSVLLGPRPPQAEVGIVKRPFNSKQGRGLVCGLVWSCVVVWSDCLEGKKILLLLAASVGAWCSSTRCEGRSKFPCVDWTFLCPSRHTTAPFGSPTTQACIVKGNSSCTERKQGMVGEKQEHGAEAEATRLHCLPLCPPPARPLSLLCTASKRMHTCRGISACWEINHTTLRTPFLGDSRGFPTPPAKRAPSFFHTAPAGTVPVTHALREQPCMHHFTLD